METNIKGKFFSTHKDVNYLLALALKIFKNVGKEIIYVDKHGNYVGCSVDCSGINIRA